MFYNVGQDGQIPLAGNRSVKNYELGGGKVGCCKYMKEGTIYTRWKAEDA